MYFKKRLRGGDLNMLTIETDRLILKDGTIEDWIKVHEYDFNYLMDINGIFKYVTYNF